MKKNGIEFYSYSNRDYGAYCVYSDRQQLLYDLFYGDLQYLAFDDDDPFWNDLSCE